MENNNNIKLEEIEKNNKLKNENSNKRHSTSLLRDTNKKPTNLSSKIFLNMKEEMAKKKKKQISLKEINDKDIQDLYIILKKSNKERKKKDTVDIFSFLLKTKIKDFLKSDLLYTEYNLDILYNFINPYISGDIFHSGEMIYSYGEEAENIYIILKGCIGQYKLEESKELLACEDYYSYLSDKFQHFKKTMIEQSDDSKSIYINEKEYIDIHLLRKMVSINKDIFPLYSFDDIEDLKKIVLEIKIYTKLLENKTAEINDMFQKFNFPLSFLNYDKFLNNDITIFNYIKYLSKRIKQREQFYMKFLGKTTEYKVKLMKYVKVEVLKPYDYFGNFEMIDTKPCRNDAARCESDYTVLMCINKQLYSKVINNIQKNKREKEIIFLHNHFYFKNINRIYFESKMFIKYKIDNYLKGNILINQGEQLNNFIFVREGTIETSINNISLLELANKIKSLQEFIIGKAKEYDINPKDIIDFDISLNHKTSLKLELIEGILKQKQNFVLSRVERGCFGEYEYYFNTPSFVTETIISKNGKVYFYDYENFKKVNEEVHAFNEILKEISFNKLKSILKRMVTIYNSSFKFNMKQIEKKIIEKENILKNLDSSNSIGGDGDLNFYLDKQKHFSSPITIFKKNTNNLYNIINTNNDYNNSKNSLEKNVNKIKEINAFSHNLEKIAKFRQNTFSKIKSFQPKNENISSLRKKIINLKNNLNKNIKKNINSFSTDNSFKEKKIDKIDKIDSKSIKNKFMNSKKKIKINQLNIIKTKNNQKEKPFNVFLPPLLTLKKNKNQNNNESDKKNLYQNKNMKIDYHFFRHSLSIANSINDASLGHKDKNNLDKMILSNLDYNKLNKYTKKSKSINIKKAQINIIKNRSKKIKLVLQKKNDEDPFCE